MHDGRVAGGVVPDISVGALRFWDTATSWLHIETSPGAFSWTALDTAVAAAENAGARPLLVLGQTPRFHASRPDQPAAYGPGAASMPDIAAWRRYVRAVAERYGTRIDYQIWNESNVAGYWAGTPADLAELTIVAAGEIRQRAPDAVVVAPPFALRLQGQRRYFEKFWSLRSSATTLADLIDAVAVHLYPAADDPPEAQVALLDDARAVLKRQGLNQIPIWNTEINYGLLGGPEPPTIPRDLQRAYLMRTYLLNAGLGVERVYWYRWDMPPIANTLLTSEDYATVTTAGRALETVQRWLTDSRVSRCEAIEGVWRCAASRRGESLAFLWKPLGPAIDVVERGAVDWVGADGVVARCRSRCALPVGRTPIMVRISR